MRSQKPSKQDAFTGTTVALRDCGKDNLFQLLLLEINDGVIVSEHVLTSPDSPAIIIAKAEQVLWTIRSESLEK